MCEEAAVHLGHTWEPDQWIDAERPNGCWLCSEADCTTRGIVQLNLASPPGSATHRGSRVCMKGCDDQPGALHRIKIGNTPATCAQLAHDCDHFKYGARIRGACPFTCGACHVTAELVQYERQCVNHTWMGHSHHGPDGCVSQAFKDDRCKGAVVMWARGSDKRCG